jgi:hypothetical protein
MLTDQHLLAIQRECLAIAYLGDGWPAIDGIVTPQDCRQMGM